MDLRKLEIFVCVSDLKSFSLAGKKLFMAQPAVSIAIKKLEHHFDTLLLHRDGKKVTLTEEGKVAYKLASELLSKAKHLQQTMQDLRGLIVGEVTIACPSMVATYFLPSVLSNFLQQYPGLKINVVQAGTQKIEALLEQGKTEFGVVIDKISTQNLQSITLLTEQIYLFTTKTHALSSQRKIEAQQLHGQDMVLYESDYFIRNTFNHFCKVRDVKPDIRLETNFLPLIINAVKQNLGATVGLSMMLENEPDLVGIPLSPPQSIKMSLAWRSGTVLSRANQCFVDWLVNSQQPQAH